MIASTLVRELVVREYRPACNWAASEIEAALNDCLKERDIVGASALFGRINQEHKTFFGFDFRERTVDSDPPEGAVQEAIVLNCERVAQCYQLLRQQSLLSQ